MINSEEKSAGIFERHVQTVLVSLITMGIGYMVAEQVNAGKTVAHTTVQIGYLTQQVVELRTDIKAMQIGYVRSEQFVDHETRLRALEAKGVLNTR